MDKDGQRLVQSSSLPPAQPTYVFRGHTAQIHALHFFRQNLRLLSGDAHGWVVLWSMTIRRPVAVWKAHSNAILGLGSWKNDRIITHGRDSKIHVWQLREEDEKDGFSTTLPIDDATSDRKQPWLLHSLTVNTLNFCSFAMCEFWQRGTTVNSVSQDDPETILVATPGLQDGHINVTSLPSEDRVATIPNPKDVSTGLLMAIGVCYLSGELTLIAGYESGHTAVWQQNHSKRWQTTYVSKSHTQPVLSLDIAQSLHCFFSTSADAIVAQHPLGDNGPATKSVQTKHAGQQSLAMRSDDKIFVTAGWDGRARVYSSKTMKELAVLKWHKDGCYATALADVSVSPSERSEDFNTDDTVTKRTLTVSEQRIESAKSTHWLAAGSKDGKISLWDVY